LRRKQVWRQANKGNRRGRPEEKSDENWYHFYKKSDKKIVGRESSLKKKHQLMGERRECNIFFGTNRRQSSVVVTMGKTLGPGVWKGRRIAGKIENKLLRMVEETCYVRE